MKAFLRKVRRWWLRPVEQKLERLALEQGRVQAQLQQSRDIQTLSDAEFGVFSQNGEDGVLQYLTRRVPLAAKTFVEFGVQDYRESNTRLLVEKDRWSGWILDGGDAHLRYVKQESFLGQDADLTAIQAFITKDNIESLLQAAGVPEDLGLLSVDIDGNDYWVFEAIQRVKARIVVLEYNSLLGPEKSLSLPYVADYVRTPTGAAQYYFGASLWALTELANAKGYALVGCESRGSNAFYVRRDCLNGLKEVPVQEAWQALTPGPGMRYPLGLEALKDRMLVEPSTGKTATVAQWYGL